MGKIIITGPGRSGTTFLVQLFGRLGFDTGFTEETETYVEEIRAGCEWHLEFDVNQDSLVAIRARIEAAPRVLKTPDWAFVLKWALHTNVIDIDHVFIPLRDIDQAARSRLGVGLDWHVADDLQGEERVVDQANIMALALGRAIEACFLFEVPCTLMRFPAIVSDPGYCYQKLRPVMNDISQERFLEEWQKLARPEQVRTK